MVYAGVLRNEQWFSNRKGRKMMHFSFFNILDLFYAYLDDQLRVLGGLYHCAKFGYDRCSSFGNMSISIFSTFRWKTPIHSPKIQ